MPHLDELRQDPLVEPGMGFELSRDVVGDDMGVGGVLPEPCVRLAYRGSLNVVAFSVNRLPVLESVDAGDAFMWEDDKRWQIHFGTHPLRQRDTAQRPSPMASQTSSLQREELGSKMRSVSFG